MKHTPGPWIVREQGFADEFFITTDKNRWLFSFRQNGELWTEEERANAKLIALAPEMLKTLQSVNRYFVDLQNRCALTVQEENTWKKVSKAIKNATE